MRATSRQAELLAGLVLLAGALGPCPAARADERVAVPSSPRYVFQPMGVEAGLSTRSANSILQDETGFIWLATIDGVYRFDGSEFVLFGGAERAPAAYHIQLHEGPDGKIWAATGSQISWYDGRRFRGLEPVGGHPVADTGADVRQRLAVDSKNVVYIANDRQILAINGRRVAFKRAWTASDGLPEAKVRAIHAAADGQVWFVAGRQVGRIDPADGRLEMIASDGIPDDDAIAILVDREGTVWVRSENHLVRRAAGEDRFVRDDEGLAEAYADGLPGLDREGNLLVPTRNGLFMRRDGGWQSVSARDGLAISAVASAIEDRDGALWIGLAGAGLVRWAWRSRWSAWTSREGLPDDVVWGSLRDDEGRLWVGTNNGVGIWLPDEQRWKVLRHEDGLAAYAVWKFAVGQDGRVWSLSRRSGLNRYDPVTLEPEIIPLPEDCRSNPMDLEAGPDRTLWVSGKDDLLTIRDRGELRYEFERVELPEQLVGATETIAVAPDGVVWIAGSRGLGRYDGTNWRSFGTADGLQSQRVLNVSAVSGDEVWLSYEEPLGVTRLTLGPDGLQVQHLGRDQGLLSNTVWLLQHDPLGRIWVAGSDGLSAILPDGTIRGYDQGDGLIWNDISQDSLWMEPDGSIFVGTSRGLAHHDPSADKPVNEPPNVVLNSVTLGGRELVGERSAEVAHDQGTFTAAFSGLTFRNPPQVRFKYQLIGLDSEPILTKQRQVRYPALAPGAYRFEVSCRSAAGVWSAEPASFAFSVRPPWWERWWTRLAAVVAIVLLVLALLWVRTRRLEAERRRLEAAVEERSAQLAEANRELREMSFTDALTRVRNRRFFATVIDDTVATTVRRHDPRSSDRAERNRDLIFYIVDLDHFKKVNDAYGHMVGDKVLIETARRLEGSVRQADLVVRWGGEEFLLVCRDAERSEADRVARRILEEVGGAPLIDEDGLRVQRTCSVGWVALPAFRRHPEVLPHEVLLEVADMALYLAKQSGRNQAIGVEFLEDEYQRARSLEWLELPLDQLQGDLVRLKRIQGPDVDLDPITSVSPVSAPWRRKSRIEGPED